MLKSLSLALGCAWVALEEVRMVLTWTCTICSSPLSYVLECDRIHEGVCHDCASRNLTAQCLDPTHYPSQGPEGRRLTSRQQDAMLRLATAHAREAEHQRYEVECRAALQQLLAQEDTP
jgi:hypothetical protein